MLVLANDPGFGSQKLVFRGTPVCLQTAVSRPKNIGMASIGMKSAGDQALSVEWDGHRFCVGPGAWYRGEPASSMDFSSIVGPERLAMLYATYYMATKDTEPINDKDIFMVVGLPVPLLQDETQAQLVVDSLKTLKRLHKFSVNGTELEFNISRIGKAAQPVGAYINWFLTDDLKQRQGAKGSEVAVLDVGMNTLDLYVVVDGRVVDTFVGGAEVGVKRLLNMIKTNGHDISELDARFRDGRLKAPQPAVDAWISELMAVIKDTMPDMKRFDAVIPVGGGVIVAGQKLIDLLANSRGAKIFQSQNPVMENALGLYKYGLKHL